MCCVHDVNSLFDHFSDFFGVELKFFRRFQIVHLRGDLSGAIRQRLDAFDAAEGSLREFELAGDVA